MSRTSSDYYHIPLRSLGRGRRKVTRTPSTSSFRDDRNGYASVEATGEDDDDERVSGDESPLINKYQVRCLSVVAFGRRANGCVDQAWKC